MNNRLGELPSWAADSDDDDVMNSGSANAGGGDVEMADAGPKQPKHMEHFFREVENIKADIDAVKKATKSIGDYNDQALQATTTEEENELSRKLRNVVDQTNKRAKRTKTMLGLLKEETQKLQTENSIKQNDLRVRENLCSTLTRRFIDEMKAYQSSQQKYKTDIKKKVARQVRVVKADATDEEIDEVMRSEGGRDALYRQQILAGGVNDQIKTAYNKVAGKYQDVLALEQSVAELHQMFLDMALLTEQQGELLDQIEFQVKQAGDYIEEANVDTYEAIEYQRKIRNKQCWILLIVAVASAVIIFVVFKP